MATLDFRLSPLPVSSFFADLGGLAAEELERGPGFFRIGATSAEGRRLVATFLGNFDQTSQESFEASLISDLVITLDGVAAWQFLGLQGFSVRNYRQLFDPATVEAALALLLAGADELLGSPGGDRLSSLAGDDRIDAGQGADTLEGGAGNDLLFGGGGNDLLSGGEGNDALFGGEGNDEANGNGGADRVVGEGGDDELRGGAGDDTVEGGLGADTLVGGGGNDLLSGGEGNDALFGGEGNDEANGNGGADRVVGEGGDDELRGGAGDDTVEGGLGADTLVGGGGNDLLSGGEGNDALFGGEGNDNLRGDGGNDRLQGEEGNDVLEGGSGDDTLFGGVDADTHTGNGDADTFVTQPGTSPAATSVTDLDVGYNIIFDNGVDIITDFSGQFYEGDEIAYQGSSGNAAFEEDDYDVLFGSSPISFAGLGEGFAYLVPGIWIPSAGAFNSGEFQYNAEGGDFLFFVAAETLTFGDDLLFEEFLLEIPSVIGTQVFVLLDPLIGD